MGGFVLVLEKSGKPCDLAILEQMNRTLEVRGPDGAGIKACGSVGMGATLFRTLEDTADATQPLSLDGTVWIVGDVRMDDRLDLVDRLRGAGCAAAMSDPDLLLLLKTYLVWGTRCVQHILGDFSFVIWDQTQRRVFAARDHFGIRPLFHVDNSQILAFSNSLECLLRHPAADRALDELYFADALLFGWGQDPSASAFQQIRRLEAAHCIIWSENGLLRERYWELPAYPEPLRFRNPTECVDQFRELLRTAVGDRLRARSVALELSGGVDSTCVAATASDLRQSGRCHAEFHAWTCSSPQLLPQDREAEFAALAADALGMSHRIFDFDDYALFRQKSGELVQPGSEPHGLMLLAGRRDYATAIRANSRVLITGQGGDGVFAGSPLHFLRQLRRGEWGRAFWQTANFFLSRGRLPPFGVRSRVKRYLGLWPTLPEFPRYLERDFVDRLDLRERWTRFFEWSPRITADVRQEAAQLMRRSWDQCFASYDPSLFGTPIDVRHPLFDLRIVNFLLRVPPLPWLADKDLVREVWSDTLPVEIRGRSKFPLQGDPLKARLMKGQLLSADPEVMCQLSDYVDLENLPTLNAECLQSVSGRDCWATALVTSCGIWINQFLKRGYLK